MTILEEIIQHKKQEVAANKALYPAQLLQQSIYFETQPVSLKAYLQRDDKVGIIAEIKRKSPSRGMIHEFIDVEKTSMGYMQAGASGLSVLTDKKYFGGQNADLEVARKFNYCPILRKDFIIDEYQIIEAKSIGADVILLIAANLEPQVCAQLAQFAQSLQLEVLLEITSMAEFNSHYNEHIDIVGINNRDLHTMTTNVDHTFKMCDELPKDLIKISESGISKPQEIIALKDAGMQGFLMGTFFMQQEHPHKACAAFIQAVRKLEAEIA